MCITFNEEEEVQVPPWVSIHCEKYKWRNNVVSRHDVEILQ